MKIHKDDQVIIIAGKDKGKKAKVLKAIPSENKVIVEGVGMVTRHMKRQGSTPGQKVSFEKPVDVSNVMLVDPKSGKPTRIAYKMENGIKVGRIAKNSGTTL
jgi:large subunit ribosomal protein L24